MTVAPAQVTVRDHSTGGSEHLHHSAAAARAKPHVPGDGHLRTAMLRRRKRGAGSATRRYRERDHARSYGTLPLHLMGVSQTLKPSTSLSTSPRTAKASSS